MKTIWNCVIQHNSKGHIMLKEMHKIWKQRVDWLHSNHCDLKGIKWPQNKGWLRNSAPLKFIFGGTYKYKCLLHRGWPLYVEFHFFFKQPFKNTLHKDRQQGVCVDNVMALLTSILIDSNVARRKKVRCASGYSSGAFTFYHLGKS